MLIRSITADIKKQLEQQKKIIIISGPRQSGKTTLAKNLCSQFTYLNYDDQDHRLAIIKKRWDRKSDLVIFDELHKMKKFKSWLKGIYDTKETPQNILVTGSAKLNAYQQFGDSLAGRQYNIRLHPLDLKELHSIDPDFDETKYFNRLLELGGFPEPFLSASLIASQLWRKNHLEIIIKQDVIDYESIKDLKSLEVLVHLLSERVGSVISNDSLAKDLNKDPKTIKRWLEVLENMYIIFQLKPYHKNYERSVKKQSKYYFYDTGAVRGDLPQKFENLVACSLLKEIHFLQDTAGIDIDLYYLKIKGGKEVDFYVDIPGYKSWMIEVKWSDVEPAQKQFQAFYSQLQKPHQIQLVAQIEKETMTDTGIEIRSGRRWLANMNLLDLRKVEKIFL